jgi:hypothetical protein
VPFRAIDAALQPGVAVPVRPKSSRPCVRSIKIAMRRWAQSLMTKNALEVVACEV